MGWCPAGPVLTSWGDGASLPLFGCPSSYGVTIKMQEVFYIDQLGTPSFPIGLVKIESGFNVISVETGLGI